MSKRTILGTVTALVLMALMALGAGCPKRSSTSHPEGDKGEQPDESMSEADRACVQDLKPFFASERRKMDKNEDQITNLQFYLSREIVLKRVLTSAEVKVTPQHRLQFVKGKHYETIRIKCRTPGVVPSVGSGSLHAAFDPKKPESVLGFEETGKRGVYCLVGEWPRDEEEGTVTYEGKTFKAPVAAKRSCLYVMKENKKTKTEKHRELKGIKLKGKGNPARPVEMTPPVPSQ